MALWTRTESKPGLQVWKRNLGVTEACFHWESLSTGFGDTLIHVHLSPTRRGDMDIHSCANVRRAWCSVKRRFPIMAGEIHGEGHEAHFVVREEKVRSLHEGDITFDAITSFHAADQFVTDVLDGLPPLSPKLLARIYVLRRTDRPQYFHVVLVVAHCITDRCSTSTILRTFLQTLASSYDPAPPPIPSRLQMCLPAESRIGLKDLSLPRRRWRKAIGYALHATRLARFKGGHTIPGNFTTARQRASDKSRVQLFTFSRSTSSTILSNCKRHGITLTCAYYAISQVVLSRLICRRYLKGDISEEEWQYRIREPMFFNAPLDLRAHMDRDWFQQGGSGEVGFNAVSSQYVLPFMPLGAMRNKGDVRELELVDGAPHFPELMSFKRFLHRCGIARAQFKKLLDHPRFVDICTSAYYCKLPHSQQAAGARRTATERLDEDTETEGWASPIPVSFLGPVITQDGSSMGNMDVKLPADYPLPASHPLSPLSQAHHPHRAGYTTQPVPNEVVRECETPRLHVEYWRTHMHIGPAGLYLGSWLVQGQLQFVVFYDECVFSREVVAEWLSEIKEGLRWYLGQPLDETERGHDSVPAAKL